MICSEIVENIAARESLFKGENEKAWISALIFGL